MAFQCTRLYTLMFELLGRQDLVERTPMMWTFMTTPPEERYVELMYCAVFVSVRVVLTGNSESMDIRI